jgi:hypothetical protein
MKMAKPFSLENGGDSVTICHLTHMQVSIHPYKIAKKLFLLPFSSPETPDY